MILPCTLLQRDIWSWINKNSSYHIQIVGTFWSNRKYSWSKRMVAVANTCTHWPIIELVDWYFNRATHWLTNHTFNNSLLLLVCTTYKQMKKPTVELVDSTWLTSVKIRCFHVNHKQLVWQQWWCLYYKMKKESDRTLYRAQNNGRSRVNVRQHLV